MEALATSALLTAIRARLADQVADATVLARVGETPSAANQHRAIAILEVQTEAPPREQPMGAYYKTERQIRLQWWHAERGDFSDADVADWAASIRKALSGPNQWAFTYLLRFAGEPPALSRADGYYTGFLDLVCTRGLPME